MFWYRKERGLWLSLTDELNTAFSPISRFTISGDNREPCLSRIFIYIIMQSRSQLLSLSPLGSQCRLQNDGIRADSGSGGSRPLRPTGVGYIRLFLPPETELVKGL